MRDVGDVHVQNELAIVEAIHPNGVVEVARGFTVDGDDVVATEISTSRGVGRAGVQRHVVGFQQHRGGEGVRQTVFADDHFDVDAEVVALPEHFDDATHAQAPAVGRFHHFRMYDQAVQVLGGDSALGCGADAVLRLNAPGPFPAGRDFEPLADAPVVRLDEVRAAARVKLAHHRERRDVHFG